MESIDKTGLMRLIHAGLHARNTKCVDQTSGDIYISYHITLDNPSVSILISDLNRGLKILLDHLKDRE